MSSEGLFGNIIGGALGLFPEAYIPFYKMPEAAHQPQEYFLYMYLTLGVKSGDT